MFVIPDLSNLHGNTPAPQAPPPVPEGAEVEYADTGAFYNDVLPASGLYVVTDNKERVGVWHNSPQTLRAGARQSQDRDTYFSTASYATTENRKGSNALLRRAFVLDVDVKPGVEGFYHDKGVAKAVLAYHISVGSVPNPSYIVDSGGGLQVYWLGRDYDMAAWSAVDAAFCAYLVDTLPARMVSDITTSKRGPGLYRAPGTRNHKEDTPRPAKVIYYTGETHEHWLEALEPGLARDSRSPQGVVAGVGAWHFPCPPYIDYKYDPAFARSCSRSSYDAHSHESAYASCAQYRHAVDHGPSQPLSYHGWWGTGALMSRFPDGAERFEAWSQQFPTYDPVEVGNKWHEFEQKNASSSPMALSCPTYAEYVGDPTRSRCAGCKFLTDKNSPVSAAEVRAAPAPVVKAMPLEELDGEFTRLTTEAPMPVWLTCVIDGAGNAVPALRNNTYYANYDTDKATFGVYRKGKTDPKGVTAKDSRVLTKLVYIESSWRSPDARGEHERSLDVWVSVDHTGKRTKKALPATVRNNPAAFRTAVDVAGLGVWTTATPQHAFEYLTRALTSYEDTQGDAGIVAARFGWQGALPETTDGCPAEPASEPVGASAGGWSPIDILDAEIAPEGPDDGDADSDKLCFAAGDDSYIGGRRSRTTKGASRDVLGVGRKGQWAKQLSALRVYDTPEISGTVHAMLAFAVSSPLLHLLDGSTIMVHAHAVSGAAKTSLQKVCSSMFGEPTIHASGKDTLNAASDKIARLRHLPATYDELEKESDNAGRGASSSIGATFLRALSSNKERSRLVKQADGTFVATEGLDYCTNVIASSNLTLTMLLDGGMSEKADAARARVLHLEEPDSLVPRTPEWEVRFDAVNVVLKHHHGHIGPLFVDYVIDNRDVVLSRVRVKEAELRSVALDRQQDRFIILNTAAATVAGEIMQELGWFMTSSTWTRKAIDRIKHGDPDKLKPKYAPAYGEPVFVPDSPFIDIPAVAVTTAPPTPAMPRGVPSAAEFMQSIEAVYGGFIVRAQGGATPMSIGPPMAGRFGGVQIVDAGVTTTYILASLFDEHCRSLGHRLGTPTDGGYLLRCWKDDPNFSEYQKHSFAGVARAQDFPDAIYHVYRRTT